MFPIRVKAKCSNRILESLKYEDKTVSQLSEELFVNRRDVKSNLDELCKMGKVFRKFFHNAKTNRPDYLYSYAKFPSKYASLTRINSVVVEILGRWDSVDIRKSRR